MQGGGGGEADRARAEEEDRQKGIRAGTARINQIFDGTGKGINVPTAIDPSRTYYDQNGLVFDPTGRMARMGGGGGTGLFGTGGGGDDAARKKAAYEQAAASGELFSDRQSTGNGFDDNFYAGRKQAYLDYANPQLEKQREDAARELTFSLARSGNLDSSARVTKETQLADLFGQRSREVGQQAVQQEADARNAVEGARGDLITMLQATGDAEGAANSAIQRSKALSMTPAYSPLGQLFTDFTSTLGTQAAAERAASLSGGYYKPAVDTGLFGVKNAVQVRNT